MDKDMNKDKDRVKGTVKDKDRDKGKDRRKTWTILDCGKKINCEKNRKEFE
jgi:hypothetical protein